VYDYSHLKVKSMSYNNVFPHEGLVATPTRNSIFYNIPERLYE